MATPTNPTLLPDPACLHLTHLEAYPQLIIAYFSTISPKGLPVMTPTWGYAKPQAIR
jgi:hypothetical protein